MEKKIPASENRLEHTVSGHIRKLPNGCQATEKARVAAKKIMSRNLGNNETFVCKYVRNKGGLKTKIVPETVMEY